VCGRLQVHWSCRSGDANKLSSLIDAGYNLKIKNKKGETGLHIACFSGSNACCEVRPHGAPFPVSDVLSPMLRCATGGQRPARVQGLASLHAVIRDAFRANYSPLRFLSSLSTLSLLSGKVLAASGKFPPEDLDMLDVDGWGSLHWAVEQNNLHCVRIMLMHRVRARMSCDLRVFFAQCCSRM
jgi:hypothetical protein